VANPAAKPPVSPASIAASPAVAKPAALSPPAKKKFNALFILLPLLLIAIVGVGVAWEMFRAKMEAAQQGQGGEDGLGVVGGRSGTQHERKSRELKPKEAPALPVVVSDEDELTGLGKKKKPPPPKTYPPAERAWRAVKADFDKLEARNETTARKYRIRILAMEDRKDSTLKAELSKPENQ
jgi:hypothetical protein